ncbi:MAG: hypothetical protein ACRENS_08330 [Candidatus Eiseniibacteriota bacterium]
MVKKPYVLAVVSFLLIPVAVILGMALTVAINPEIAAGHPDYVRNFELLNTLKRGSFFATLLMAMVLWFLTGVFLLKAKQRSAWWLPLAVLGPFGFAILAMLGDKTPAPRDAYQQAVRRLNRPLRLAYEIGLFVAFSAIAYQTIVFKRNLMIAYEALSTGTPAAQIISQQNASSGMWAFGEGLQVLFLVVLSYLIWPVCFNLARRLPKWWAASRQL